MTTEGINRLEIREEQSKDVPGIRRVNEQAFGASEESTIVDKLRRSGVEQLSLVAVLDGRLVGHILFSRATIESQGNTVVGMGLAPMAVLPEFQRQGIGSQLVRRGIDILRQKSCPFVIVVGHAEYYPRFGFEPASIHHIQCQWTGVPDEAFLILILDKDSMAGVTGTARYRDEFDEAM